MKKLLLEKFEDVFGQGGKTLAGFAPGRVNLIGEHIDYNGGHVFPCALTIGTYGAIRKRNDRKLRFFSMNFEKLGVIEADLEELVYKKEDDWANYPKGILSVMLERGFPVESGMDLLFYGNLPNGSGLSSSASIEVLTGYLVKELFGFPVERRELALIGQTSENCFNGVNCGIMDQFAVAMGKKDHAIFLDTASLEYEYAPLCLADAEIIIMNTNKRRGLGDSKYNERRRECEAALRELQKELSINSLCELDGEEFEAHKGLIGEEIVRRRARHAVCENERTILAVRALKDKNLKRFGELMSQSHRSLRDDYEVTGPELDTLVEEAWKQKGVIGARMTGAGFGGCAVGIVELAYIDSFMERVGRAYKDKIGYQADFYRVRIGDGPVRL